MVSIAFKFYGLMIDAEAMILNLGSNGISGSFPYDELSELKNLTILFLQSNNFSGPLPSDFSVWNNLTILNISNNGFNGSFPPSISNLTHLTSLNLANNFLSCNIPDINVSSLQQLELANNNFTGNIYFQVKNDEDILQTLTTENEIHEQQIKRLLLKIIKKRNRHCSSNRVGETYLRAEVSSSAKSIEEPRSMNLNRSE
ncbi:hypothetical protein NC651_009951 [Populus alba x Populus x berolinensis]|nr:hypothetical protein NC651_009951 [Populus alba x Populus x berolinensis]